MNRVFKTFCVLTFIVSSSYATSKALDPVFSFDRASNQEHASLTRSPSSEVNENIEYPAPLAVQDPAIHPTNPVIDPIRFSALKGFFSGPVEVQNFCREELATANPSGSVLSFGQTKAAASNLDQTSAPRDMNQARGQIEVASSGGHGFERGGGDFVAIEFMAYGQAFLRDLIRLQSSGSFKHIDADAVRKALESFKIIVKDHVILDQAGNPRTAVTDLREKVIEVNRLRWNAGDSDIFVRAQIVVHEYMRASGYSQQDDLYGWSNQFIANLKLQPYVAFLFQVNQDRTQEVLVSRVINQSVIVCKGPQNVQLALRSSGLGLSFDLRGETMSTLNNRLSTVSLSKTFSNFTLLSRELGIFHLNIYELHSKGPELRGNLFAPEAGLSINLTCQKAIEASASPRESDSTD